MSPSTPDQCSHPHNMASHQVEVQRDHRWSTANPCPPTSGPSATIGHNLAHYDKIHPTLLPSTAKLFWLASHICVPCYTFSWAFSWVSCGLQRKEICLVVHLVGVCHFLSGTTPWHCRKCQVELSFSAKCAWFEWPPSPHLPSPQNAGRHVSQRPWTPWLIHYLPHLEPDSLAFRHYFRRHLPHHHLLLPDCQHHHPLKRMPLQTGQKRSLRGSPSFGHEFPPQLLDLLPLLLDLSCFAQQVFALQGDHPPLAH